MAGIAVYTNLQWAKTWAKARGACRRRYVDIPAKLTGPRHELCTWGEPTRPGVGSLSRKRYTQYVEHNRKGHSWVLWHAQSLGNRLAATVDTREPSENWKGTNNGGDAVCHGAEKCY